MLRSEGGDGRGFQRDVDSGTVGHAAEPVTVELPDRHGPVWAPRSTAAMRARGGGGSRGPGSAVMTFIPAARQVATSLAGIGRGDTPWHSQARPAGVEPGLQPQRIRIGLDDDWRFIKDDLDGAERPLLDEGAWRRLDIPHDWAIEGPFDEKNGPGSGALPSFGVAW